MESTRVVGINMCVCWSSEAEGHNLLCDLRTTIRLSACEDKTAVVLVTAVTTVVVLV